MCGSRRVGAVRSRKRRFSALLSSFGVQAAEAARSQQEGGGDGGAAQEIRGTGIDQGAQGSARSGLSHPWVRTGAGSRSKSESAADGVVAGASGASGLRPPASPSRSGSFGSAQGAGSMLQQRPHAPPPKCPEAPVVSSLEAARLGLGKGPDGGDKLLNPLAPCGSCTEWLRKIAEANPEFKTLTFSDTKATHVYVREVEPAL